MNKWLLSIGANNLLHSFRTNAGVFSGNEGSYSVRKLAGWESCGGDSIAAFFWNTVIDHHSFDTGSNSDTEHFFKPDDQSDHLAGYTGESCNVYNMLKLTRHLYEHTASMKYADYFSQTRIEILRRTIW